MSQGVTIITSPESNKEYGCYLQNLAAELACLAACLRTDECPLEQYFFSPEDQMPEELLKDYYSDQDLVHIRHIIADDYYPAEMILADVDKAIALLNGYDEDWFRQGKEALLSDMQELKQTLSGFKDKSIKTQLCIA